VLVLADFVKILRIKTLAANAVHISWRIYADEIANSSLSKFETVTMLYIKNQNNYNNKISYKPCMLRINELTKRAMHRIGTQFLGLSKNHISNTTIPIKRVHYHVDDATAMKSSHELTQKNPLLRKQWMRGPLIILSNTPP
jgi:hypothetical protein